MKFIAFMGVLICGGMLLAKSTRPPTPPSPQQLALRRIGSDLQSPTASVRAGAGDAVARLVSADPDTLAMEFRNWVKPLMDDGQYDLVERAGLVALIHRPQNPMDVSNIQAARVQALLSEQKYEQALSEAKSYYNVATMKQTSAAIDLMAEALQGARGKTEHGIGLRFRKQQLAGAAPPDVSGLIGGASNGPLAFINDGSNRRQSADILNSIKIDSTPYDAAITKLQNADSYDDLMAEGNLLLLADRPSEAKACFRKLAERETTRGKNLSAALEGIARAIRAEDGSVGRANAFIEALKGK